MLWYIRLRKTSKAERADGYYPESLLDIHLRHQVLRGKPYKSADALNFAKASKLNDSATLKKHVRGQANQSEEDEDCFGYDDSSSDDASHLVYELDTMGLKRTNTEESKQYDSNRPVATVGNVGPTIEEERLLDKEELYNQFVDLSLKAQSSKNLR